MRIICVEDDTGLRNVILDTLHYLEPNVDIDVFANSDDVLPAINLPDTVGYALPKDIERIFTTVGARIGDRWETHNGRRCSERDHIRRTSSSAAEQPCG